MIGLDLLDDMGESVRDRNVTDIFYGRPDPVRRRAGGYVLAMRLPFVSREDMDIHRRATSSSSASARTSGT